MKEFTIMTKFDLGETAYFYNSSTHKLEEFVVEKISYDRFKERATIMYSDGVRYLFGEQLFRSKQEFIDSL